jgi:pyroglutamyl-peptidase
VSRPALVYVTGFGPFEAVGDNPSAHVARALEAEPPAGVDVACAVLPASFERAAPAFDAGLARLGMRRPALLLALGVQSRGTGFRLERCAARLLGGRADVDGRTADGLALAGGARRTALDVERLAAELGACGAGPVVVSDDAGGYVCERIYHHALGAGELRGAAALFLHLPPGGEVPAARQVEIVRCFLPRVLGLTRAG